MIPAFDAVKAINGLRGDAVVVGTMTPNRYWELVSERPELRERLVEDRPYIAAEAVQSARREMALHVEDVAFRRTHVGLETEEFGAAIRRIAVLMRDELGWDEAREQAEIARAEAVRERNELFRSELEALEAPSGSEGP